MMSVEILHSHTQAPEHALPFVATGKTETQSDTMTKLRDKIGQMFGRKTMVDSGTSSVIETDFLEEREGKLDGRVFFSRNGGSSENLLPASTNVTPQHEPLLVSQPSVDEQQWMDVVHILHTKLQESSQLPRFAELYEFLLPCNLVEKIGKDVVRMSCCEPCGLRGLVLHINLQRKQDKEIFNLGKVLYDPNTVATFELYLTLIEDKKKWFHLKDLFAPLVHGCLSESLGKEEIYISPGYQMEKKKLYTQNQN